jgi:hypothetical protein
LRESFGDELTVHDDHHRIGLFGLSFHF